MPDTVLGSADTLPCPVELPAQESDKQRREKEMCPRRQKKYNHHHCSPGDGGDVSGALTGELGGQGSPLEGDDI